MSDAASDFSFPLRLGFGCAGAWAKPWFSAREAHSVLRAALEAGVRHLDTGGFYAGGEAERRVGAVLKDFREPVFVSTKTGTRYRGFKAPVKDFSAAAIRADVEASLARLGRERLDLVYLHGPSNPDLRRGLEVLTRLKEEGKIVRAGVCADGKGVLRAVKSPGVDVVMAACNIFRRDHEPAFRRAKKNGIGVVAIAPLAQGLYRRDLLRPRGLPDLWHAARALMKNRPALARARAAADSLESIEGWTPAQLALAYVHTHRAIDVAIASTTRPAHLAELVAAAGRPLPAEARALFDRLALDGAGGGA